MRKLLLINPFNGGMSDYMIAKHNQEPAVIRYGILSIASYVKENMGEEMDVKLLDFTSREFAAFHLEQFREYLTAFLQEYQPDFIGISAMFNFLLDTVLELLRVCRAGSPEGLVFAGGPCSMAYSERILAEGAADAVCCFEGEIPILKLCRSKNPRLELEQGKSWQTPARLKAGVMPAPEMIEDLDEIPPLRFDLVSDLEQYMSADSIYNLEGKPYRSLPIHTSRGCPFNCVFCASHYVHGKRMRAMSAKRVLEDVKRMVDEYQIDQLEICDDQFLLQRGRAKEILEGLEKFHLKLVAGSGVSIFALDDEMAGLLKRAGMDTVSLALESGCQNTLKQIIDKPVDLTRAEHVVKVLKANEIRVHAFVVIGFPGETRQARQESLDYLRRSAFDWFSIACATPLKGSRLYDQCVEKHYVDEDLQAKDGFHRSAISTEDFTAEEISEESYRMNLELNFLNNYNLRTGNYRTACEYFRYVARKFPFHAFAHYCLARAMEGLRPEFSEEECQKEMDEFWRITAEDQEWSHYANYFHLV